MLPTDPIGKHFRLAPTQVRALKKLKLETVHDLAYHFPARYDTETEIKRISDISARETVTIYGRIHGLKTRKAWVRKIPMGEGTLTDDSGSIGIVWFNQAYIAKMVGEGALVEVRGKVSQKRSGALYLSNPEIKPAGKISGGEVSHSLFADSVKNFGLPVYPESRGVTSRWFHHAVQRLFSMGLHERIPDPIPDHILKQYSLPTLSTALVWMHTPQNEHDSIAARKRFAFE